MSEIDLYREQLALANHVLAHEGVVDGFGHVSVRHPSEPHRYLLSRSRSPELVTAEDIMIFEHDGTVVGADDRKPYLERYIHGALYEARPDVHSVVHNHAYDLLPFAVTGTPIKPAIHVAALIGSNVPVWDIRDKFGATNLLVTSMDQGHDLAVAVGNGNAALMRGHGAVISGASIQGAVITAIYLKVNAQIISSARDLGNIKYLSEEEIDLCAKAHEDPLVLERIWEYFLRRAEKTSG